MHGAFMMLTYKALVELYLPSHGYVLLIHLTATFLYIVLFNLSTFA
jgi:hypothetical protein